MVIFLSSPFSSPTPRFLSLSPLPLCRGNETLHSTPGRPSPTLGLVQLFLFHFFLFPVSDTHFVFFFSASPGQSTRFSLASTVSSTPSSRPSNSRFLHTRGSLSWLLSAGLHIDEKSLAPFSSPFLALSAYSRQFRPPVFSFAGGRLP
ncbi:hypothetical protein TGDOM2_363590 [Toxoplasma gondii GAB2-2007-GAL-DOM2]|uniref:Uncharacterized protein n=5 Tax=Toxoplasma gondii TaxID=5811 RepID=S7WBS6_TOXGG|nr:hypothetical protein TGGT1_363590 [Toxoplasma gondii GT1]KFG33099.1 hypothetical protein TGFOU_363590 [Toxoplasma gondii FOU]KFG45689.1 hypothetical protein TGDOM2_363590 [Toxoplasma gondii GAB2-2007-GAL-DOM2]PUA91351.1 hypothetical protein TGBR9_363590 [Toxoplasma gondii TgCATBr9]RQX74714.1 hypothetical protein TGCAST_363590 [Toxoplasma gondii CAST]